MAIDTEKMRKAQESYQKGGDFLGFEAGDTLVYIHPQVRGGEDEWAPTEGCNFVPVVVHYGLGKNNGMAVSLDPQRNEIIDHPWIKAELKKRKVRLTGECPVKKAIEEGTLSDAEADESRPQTRFLWGMTPLKHRSKKSAPWAELSGKPSVAFVGKQIFDGIMEQFMDHGDITDPNGAILLRISRQGDKRNTKYVVTVEPETLKKAFVLPKSLKASVAAATAEGGECDLFRIAASMVKSPAEIQAMLDGVAAESDPDDFDDDDEDETPKKGKAKPPVKTKGKAPPPEDDEDEEDEDDEPPPKAKAPVKGKKAPPPEEDEDEDEEPPPKPAKSKTKAPPPPDDDEDEEDEDDEPPPKPAKGKKAPPPADDEDEADDEDDDSEDEDDEPPPKKAAKKPAAKKPPADEDDDEDMGISELEDALEDDEDEEPAPKGKKSKK